MGRTASLCVARLLDGEAMTVCREFGISRKTGYKIFDRYKQQGLEALSDRSRRGGGDRFDDWVVVTSLSPTTSTTRPLQTARFQHDPKYGVFCVDFRPTISGTLRQIGAHFTVRDFLRFTPAPETRAPRAGPGVRTPLRRATAFS
jgi:hypothetical protein